MMLANQTENKICDCASEECSYEVSRRCIKVGDGKQTEEEHWCLTQHNLSPGKPRNCSLLSISASSVLLNSSARVSLAFRAEISEWKNKYCNRVILVPLEVFDSLRFSTKSKSTVVDSFSFGFSGDSLCVNEVFVGWPFMRSKPLPSELCGEDDDKGTPLFSVEGVVANVIGKVIESAMIDGFD